MEAVARSQTCCLSGGTDRRRSTSVSLKVNSTPGMVTAPDSPQCGAPVPALHELPAWSSNPGKGHGAPEELLTEPTSLSCAAHRPTTFSRDLPENLLDCEQRIRISKGTSTSGLLVRVKPGLFYRTVTKCEANEKDTISNE